jgi:hypothetical protein
MCKRPRSSGSSTTTIDSKIPKVSPVTEDITKSPCKDSVKIWVGKEHCFKVSKYVLTEVPWFNKFFAEQQEPPKYESVSKEQEEKLLMYYFPGNAEPVPLHTLFLILHHKLHLLPTFIFELELFQIATVCIEYDVADIVVPHVEAKKWIENLWEDNKPIDGDWVGWLKVLRQFYRIEERCPKLAIVLDVIAANMHLEDDGWTFESNNSKHFIADIDRFELSLMDPECKRLSSLSRRNY